MDTEHDLTLLFKIGEHFIDNDGYDCTDQYVQYLAENIIYSALHNPEFVGAIYDGEQLIDEDGKVLKDFIVQDLDNYGYIEYKDGQPHVQTKKTLTMDEKATIIDLY